MGTLRRQWVYALAAVPLVLVCDPAGAQERAGARDIMGPADPTRPGPTIRYRSAFEQPDHGRERQPTDWKDANDEMARLRGHVGHLREDGGPEPSAAAPAPARHHGAGH